MIVSSILQMASCSYCKVNSDKLERCSSCKAVSYCSKECQAKDWRNHRPSCRPYTIRNVPGKGRGLFATRKIIPGKIILEERPLLTLDKGDQFSFMSSHYPNIDVVTKAKILKLFDPAENLKTLDADKVDLNQLIRKNPTLLMWIESTDDEAEKILRIYTGNSINICNVPYLYNPSESGLYNKISQINHSCNPNAIWTWVRGDFKRKQVRAMKTIQKDEEIVVNYRDFVKFNFGSREYRQEELLQTFAFSCTCSECSLEGEALLENERIRAEIRDKEANIRKYSSPQALKIAVGLCQELVKLVKELDLRLEFVNQLLNTYEGAKCATMMGGFRGVPDPNIFKNEALKYCQLFGDSDINHFNTIMNSCP